MLRTPGKIQGYFSNWFSPMLNNTEMVRESVGDVIVLANILLRNLTLQFTSLNKITFSFSSFTATSD